MSNSDYNTVLNFSSDTINIEISNSLHSLLLDAKDFLGIQCFDALIRDLLTASKLRHWVDYPELLSVCQSKGMSYDELIKYIDEN